jgi:hypothetical protein
VTKNIQARIGLNVASAKNVILQKRKKNRILTVGLPADKQKNIEFRKQLKLVFKCFNNLKRYY